MSIQKKMFAICRLLSMSMAPVLVLSVGNASAAEIPSLEEIITTMEKQREQIKSLYVELKYYSTISVEPKVLISWPKYSGTLGIFDEEDHFAYKGGKRYARRIRPARMKLFQPVKPAAADPKMERLGIKSREQTQSDVMELEPDEMRGDNGKVIWIRHIDPKRGPPQVIIFPRDPKTQWVQTPTMYFGNIWWDCNTEANTQDERILQGRRLGIRDAFQDGNFTIAGTAELNGTKCVIVKGGSEIESPGHKKTSVEIKIWLDLDHGLAKRQSETRFDNGEFMRTVNSDFVEILPGLWFPRKTEVQNFAPPDAPKQYQGAPVLIWHSDLIKWSVNDVPDGIFNVVSKPGDVIFDTRLEPTRP